MANPYGAAGVTAPASAADALGLGDQLSSQRDDELEQRKRRQQMGLPEPGQSEAVRSLFNTFNTGLGGGLGTRPRGF